MLRGKRSSENKCWGWGLEKIRAHPPGYFKSNSPYFKLQLWQWNNMIYSFHPGSRNVHVYLLQHANFTYQKFNFQEWIWEGLMYESVADKLHNTYLPWCSWCGAWLGGRDWGGRWVDFDWHPPGQPHPGPSAWQLPPQFPAVCPLSDVVVLVTVALCPVTMATW